MKNTQKLFLQEIVDDLLPVLAESWIDERDVHPVGASLVMLPDELVEGKVVADIVEPPLALLQIAVDTEVSCLTFAMLRVCHTSYGCIQFATTEAAANLDRFAHRLTKRLQDVGAEIHYIDLLLGVGLIVYAFRLGGCRGVHFFDCEVHGDGSIHKSVACIGSMSV